MNARGRLRPGTRWIHRHCAVSSATRRRAGKEANALATMVRTAEEVEVAAERGVIVVAVSPAAVAVEVSGGVVDVANGNGKSSVSGGDHTGATPRIL